MSERTQVALDDRGLAAICPPEESDEDSAEDPVMSGEWLLGEADDPGTARKAWLSTGVAMLNCGGLLAAVRINAEVVWAAAGTTDLAETDRFLSGALFGGPVFMDTVYYYVLVSPRAAAKYTWSPRPLLPVNSRPDARLLSQGASIVVPMPERTVPNGNLPYWCVPAGDVGTLCSPPAVLQVLDRGRLALARQGQSACL